MAKQDHNEGYRTHVHYESHHKANGNSLLYAAIAAGIGLLAVVIVGTDLDKRVMAEMTHYVNANLPAAKPYLDSLLAFTGY